jgi:serine/threonine-protein kinase
METMHQLGRYEIVAELGRGAMGAVFRARDPRIDRTVAIKTIAVPAGAAKDFEHYRQRFFREAQAAGRLSHPGIVTIYDVGEDEAAHTPFIVMECVEGESLDRLVAAASGALPRASALELVRHIAEALDYAHGHGIVHRDIKPANIMVTAAGQPKIADFGIAKLAQAETTMPGQVVGTPAYMSPEQLNGKALDGRSDLFSLGVIAYWLLTGVKPFDGDTLTEICVQVVTKDPAPPSQVTPGISQDHDYVLSRALAKDPALRYQRGSEFAADLEDLRAGNKPRSRAPQGKTHIAPRIERTVQLPANAAIAMPVAVAPKGQNRRRKLLIYALAAIILLLAGVGLLAVNFNGSKPATLQIVGQYPFHRGEIYIWVDGDLRYHDELHAAAGPRAKPSHNSAENESLALTLPVTAGRHTIRIQVDAEGKIYDHDTAIPGFFRAYTQKTLVVDFASRNLALRWD